MKHNFKKMNDEYMISKQKIDTMADSLPTTCREMVEYYFDHKIDPRFQEFVTAVDFKKQINRKLDYSTFNDYMKHEMDKNRN